MASRAPGTKYTVFIKVPFPRGNFVDPPTANWNSSKEAALWKTLNSTPRGAGIDWENLADKFDATPSFLLQQAAWLYERQLSHVREHLQLKPAKPAPPSPQMGAGSGSGASGGHAMQRGGSRQSTHSRAPSALSLRQKTSTDFRSEIEPPSTPVQARVPYSRTTSTNTVTQIHRSPPSAAAASSTNSPRGKRLSTEAQARIPSPSSTSRSRISSDDNDSSSSEDPPIAQSRLYSRRPRFPPPKSKFKSKAPLSTANASYSDNDEDEDEDPSFLPFSTIDDNDGAESNRIPSEAKGKGREDPSATLRRYSQRTARPAVEQRPSVSIPVSASASSSDTLSSPAQPSSSIPSISSPQGVRSPNASHPNVLAALSPRQRRVATREGSEGTPSMGSSFSDLDDASITRSAMEEALAREIKAGKGSLGVVSRMGGLWRGAGGGAGAGPSTQGGRS